jgi:hypothetical protein
MASSLEIGKLVTASYLYRYWQKINFLSRTYLTFAIFLLILITSTGIFGYLSSAYQASTLQLEQEYVELELLEDEIIRLKEDQIYLKNEMNAAITSYPSNYVTAKRKAREGYRTDIKNVTQSILETSTKIMELRTTILKTGVDIGPAIFIAKSLNISMDKVVKFIIFILIFVFDPLAVMLFIAYNKILLEGKRG